VLVALGNGDGTFAGQYGFQLANTGRLAVADFNGDGKPDLALVNDGVSSTFIGVEVLLGNGDGSFTQAPGIPMTGTPRFLALADFNVDGKTDVVAGGQELSGPYSSWMFPGNGDGTFGPGVGNSFGGDSNALTADFNGDGIPDLFIYNNEGEQILLGKGDGTFNYGSLNASHVAIYGAAAGDFNGDGKIDIVAAEAGSSQINNYSASVWLNDGLGNLTESQTLYGVGNGAYSVAVGDFNGDGKLDAAVACHNANVVSVLLGNGNGTFPNLPRFAISGLATSAAVTDMNGDGKLDIVTVQNGTNIASVSLGKGSGGFAPATNFPVGNGPNSVAIGDFNRDGKPDLAVANMTDGTVAVLLNNGSGGLLAAVPCAAGQSTVSVAVGDFNGDGKLDIVAANSRSNTVALLLGNGDGTFQSAVSIVVVGTPEFLLAGDFNGDGKLDIAIAAIESTLVVTILPGKGNGTFGAAIVTPLPLPPESSQTEMGIAGADFNLDGKPDLAVTDEYSGEVWVLLGNGDGSFKTPVAYQAGVAILAVSARDLNGDGFPDLVAVNNPGNNVSILLGNGDGTFVPPVTWFPAANDPHIAVIGDFNGDGKRDLAVAGAGSVSVLLNTTP